MNEMWETLREVYEGVLFDAVAVWPLVILPANDVTDQLSEIKNSVISTIQDAHHG